MGRNEHPSRHSQPGKETQQPSVAPDPEPGTRPVRDQEAVLAAVESALVAIRRSQSRRALAQLTRDRERNRGQGKGDGKEQPADAVFQLLDALLAAEEHGERLTVTEAGAAMGVDQPRASRLAAQAMRTGLLVREADQADGRRSLLALTDGGRAALARVSAVRRGAVDEATAHWPDEDRRVFADLLTRFVRDFAAVTGPATHRD